MPTLDQTRHQNESLKLGKANRCFALETKSIMISIQYFAIIYFAFENLALG